MKATYKLIMLDKPILVNEEEIKSDHTPIYVNGVVSNYHSILNGVQPKGKKILAGHEGTKRLTFQLSDEDAKTIGFVDANKIADKLLDDKSEIAPPSYGYGEYYAGCVDGINAALSLTPKKYTAEQAMKIFYLARRGKDFDSVFEEVDKPSQFKVECTETENEIIVTKIL